MNDVTCEFNIKNIYFITPPNEFIKFWVSSMLNINRSKMFGKQICLLFIGFGGFIIEHHFSGSEFVFRLLLMNFQKDFGSVFTHEALSRMKPLCSFIRSCSCSCLAIMKASSTGSLPASRWTHSFLYSLFLMFFLSEIALYHTIQVYLMLEYLLLVRISQTCCTKHHNVDHGVNIILCIVKHIHYPNIKEMLANLFIVCFFET